MPGPLHSEAYQHFIRELVAERRRRGLTQAELASKLNKPQSFVSKSERYERRVDVTEFRSFAKALGCDPAELFAAILRTLPSED